MSATVKITCNRCGDTVTGTALEAIDWDGSHDDFCPAINQTPETGPLFSSGVEENGQ